MIKLNTETEWKARSGLAAFANRKKKPVQDVRTFLDKAKRILMTDPQRALSIAAQAQHKWPWHYLPRLTKVNCLLKLGRLDQALREADMNAEQNRGKATLEQLARVRLARGELDLALKAADQRLGMSRDARGYEIVGRVLIARDELTTAKTMLEQAVELNDGNHKDITLLLLAKTLRKLKQYEQAIEVLDRITADDQEIVGAILCRAYCYMEMRMYMGALVTFQKAEDILNEKGGYTLFDQRVRIQTGILFIFDNLKNRKKRIEKEIMIAAQKAARWLKRQDPDKMGLYQRHDYTKALGIIKQYHIR